MYMAIQCASLAWPCWNMYINNYHCSLVSRDRFSLMMECWSTDPNSRPAFSKIARTLSGYTENLAGYLDVNYNNPFSSAQNQAEEGFGNEILTRPDQLAALYDDELPIAKNRSPRGSPRASPCASPRASPTPPIPAGKILINIQPPT